VDDDPVADFDIGLLDRLFGALVGRHLSVKTDLDGFSGRPLALSGTAMECARRNPPLDGARLLTGAEAVRAHQDDAAPSNNGCEHCEGAQYKACEFRHSLVRSGVDRLK